MDDVYTGQMPGRRVEIAQNRIMNRFDTDGSGDISIAEAGDFGRMARQFTRIDANDDGMLTKGEVGDHVAQRIEMRAERMNAMAAWMNMQETQDQTVTAFDEIDADGDGMLSDAELTTATEATRAAEEAAQLRADKIAEINRMDLDGDGMLSSAELQAELDMRATAAAEQQAAASYDALDTDADGMISDTELADAIAAQTPPADDAAMPDQAMPDAEMAMASDDMMSDGMMSDGMMADGMMADDMTMTTATTTSPETMPMGEGATTVGAMPVSDSMAGNDIDTLSLIENVFEDMLEDRGQTVSMEGLASMSQSLYVQAQDILISQLEQAADLVGETDNQDDDQTVNA